MTFMDVLLLLIFVFLSLRVFFPRAVFGLFRGHFLNELFLTVSISWLTASLAFLLIYDVSVLNIVLVIVTGLVLFPMLVQIESGVFRGFALTFFVAMTAAFLLKISAVAEIFAVLSLPLFVMTFLKNFINEKQYEH